MSKNPYYQGLGAASGPEASAAESMEAGLLNNGAVKGSGGGAAAGFGLLSEAVEPSAPASASENESAADDNNDDSDEPMCRICLDTGDHDDLIEPCLCSGSSKWVHRECLDGFRAANENNYLAMTQCMSCGFRYAWVPKKNEDGCMSWIREPKWELRRRIARDVLSIVLIWVACVCALAGLILLCDSSIHSYWRALAYSFLGLCAMFGVIAIFHGCLQAMTADDQRQRQYRSTYHGNCCMYCYIGDCHCNDCGSGGNDSCAVVLLVLLVVLAFIGFVYLITLSVLVIAAEAKIHYQAYERRLTCRVYVVQDLRGYTVEQKMAVSGQRAQIAVRNNNPNNNNNNNMGGGGGGGRGSGSVSGVAAPANPSAPPLNTEAELLVPKHV